MQKAVTVLALATVGLAFDDVNSRFAYQPERLDIGFDDVSSRMVYQPQQLVDPMIIRPKTEIDPKILIRPRSDIDPKIIRRPYPQITPIYADDEELFNIHQAEEEVKKAGKFLVQHPELVKEAEQKTQEIIHRYAGHKDLLKQDAKKALEYVAQHPEILKQAAELAKNLVHHDEELFNIHQVEETIKKAGQHVAQHPEVVIKAEKTAQELIHRYAHHEDVLRQDVKEGAKFVAQHPEVIKQAIEAVKNLRKHKKTETADQELFNLGGLINDGLHIYSDVKTHNYGGLVNDGIQTVKDIKKHDDELVSVKEGLKNFVNKIGFGNKNRDYNQVISSNQQVVKDFQNQKKVVEADDELSYLNHIIRDSKDRNSESESGKKKLVTFDEVEVEDAEYFEDNDLMCVNLKIGGLPYTYCK